MRGRLWGAGAVVGGVMAGALALSPQARCAGPGLKDAAAGSGVSVGVALSWHGLTEDERYAVSLLRDYDAVTIENATKWSTVHHEAGGDPDFTRADALVRFADRAGLSIQGHPLVWDEHVPHWVPADAPDARFQALHGAYLTGIVARYAGRVSAWDVVNEVIEDDGSVSTAPNFRRLGPDGLAAAFRAAKRADPGATLAYNDYAIEWDNARQTGTLALLKRWRAAGVPVERVGIQGHMVAGLTPTRAQWRQAIQRFAALGLTVHLSELDVRTHHLVGSRDGRRLAAAKAFYDAVAACVDEPACDRVTLWGLTARWSWMNRHEAREEPVLLDAAHARLPAWYAVEDALARRPWRGCSANAAPAWSVEVGALEQRENEIEGVTYAHVDRPGDWAGPGLDVSEVLTDGLVWRLESAVQADHPVRVTLLLEGGGAPRFEKLAVVPAQAGAWTPLTVDLDLAALQPKVQPFERAVVYLEGPPAGAPVRVRPATLTPRCE